MPSASGWAYPSPSGSPSGCRQAVAVRSGAGLGADQLHPLAKAALARTGALESIRRNPYRSIVARGIELVHAVAESKNSSPENRACAGIRKILPVVVSLTT